MSRLTLRLPETLHRQLETLAQVEETSLNQYIVYTLTRQVTQAYVVQPVSAKAIAEQKASFAALRKKLGQASPAEIQHLWDTLEDAEPEDLVTEAVQPSSRLRRDDALGDKSRAGTRTRQAGGLRYRRSRLRRDDVLGDKSRAGAANEASPVGTP